MDAAELEAELRRILAPYENRLVAGQIYGLWVLRRSDAKTHDWFAGVRPGKESAKLMLLPIKASPELLEGASPELLRRRSGDALFTLKPGDETLIPELAALVARAYKVYAEAGG